MTEIVQYETMDDLERLGKAMAASGYFSDARQASQAVVKILAGREMGFGPVAAMTGIHIIEGKPTVGANLMAAAVRAHPHYDYQVKTITDNECAITFLRDGIEIGESALTLKEVNARKINMAWDKQKNEWKEKYNWKTYPKNMLFARCISNGVKWFAPDVFMGTTVYTPDELSGLDDDVIEMPTITVEAPPQPGLNDDQLAADIAHAVKVVEAAKSTAKVERPADAETVRGWLREKAESGSQEQCDATAASQVAAMFGKALKWDGASEAELRKARLLTYRYIFGDAVQSSHDMTQAQASAVIKWFGGGYEPQEPATSEARFLYHAAQVEAGQQELPLDEAQA